GHFWPFTGVQNGNQCEVTPKTGSPREIVKSLKRRDHGITACPLSCGVAGGNFSNSKQYIEVAVLPAPRLAEGGFLLCLRRRRHACHYSVTLAPMRRRFFRTEARRATG